MIHFLALVCLGLFSHVSGACPRALLQDATAAYVNAQTSGLPHLLFTPNSTFNYTYAENSLPVPLASSILATTLHIDIHRSLHDTFSCATFTELTAASNKHPYVIHTRMLFSSTGMDTGEGQVEGEKLVMQSMESVVTDEGDWVFNATGHLYWNSIEKWDAIPLNKRDSRTVIQAAADAYLDSWGDSSIKVPYGSPCARLEGGAYTGSKNTTTNTCRMPLFPLPFKITNRRYVVDEEVGAVDVFDDFPFIDKIRPEGTPSSNLVRVEGGGIRYVHELTVCATKGCGR
ncbi:hypothetical protein BKA65DRAFT_557259 [Rhexocercosporidium sp. MPI-PUGE-AT-0058]|nr:hypothetical protein BKA65DRAFT_557259 [Rhexocercosporidium sp. MPI-PUGE-AT-0058]